jgi:ribosome biogenesis GTPase A
MKLAIGFICGAAICFLIMFGIKPILPAYAEEVNPPDDSENVTQTLVGLLPDIEKIYRESLTMPFIQAESEIHDEDIANFYHALMEKTGLTDPNSN